MRVRNEDRGAVCCDATACRGKLVWQSFSQNGLALSSECPYSELILMGALMDNNSAETARLLEQVPRRGRGGIERAVCAAPHRLRRMVELRSTAGCRRGSTRRT